MEGSLPIQKTQVYEQYDWKPQLKFNDNRICLSCNGEIIPYTRRGEKYKRWTMPDFIEKEIQELLDILGLDKEAWSYLDGGLLHHKHKYFQDTIVIWDILVRNNEYLTGTSYGERHDWLLQNIGDEPFYIKINDKEWQVGIKVTEHIFVPLFFDNIQETWDMVQEVLEADNWVSGEPILEGVVLKDPSGALKSSHREKNNQDWMGRCRIKTGRHRH